MITNIKKHILFYCLKFKLNLIIKRYRNLLVYEFDLLESRHLLPKHLETANFILISLLDCWHVHSLKTNLIECFSYDLGDYLYIKVQDTQLFYEVH